MNRMSGWDRNRPIYYILDEQKQPVPAASALECERFIRDEKKRTVGSVQLAGSDIHVSTVFLGIDHGWQGPPVVFETMVYGGPLDNFCRRYCTYAEAVDGHRCIVETLGWMVGDEAFPGDD